MNILLTGCNGQLGLEFQKAAGISPFAIVATDQRELDITDEDAVANLFKPPSFDLVINAAAFTAVDQAEADPDSAYAVNRDGPANLAKICAHHGIPLIHFSTDYVFDGNQHTPYRETDATHPLGVYAVSKDEGEREVRKRLANHLIIRTSWLFSAHGNNFVKTILRLARERELLRVVDDQLGCPTSAKDLAHVALDLAKRVQRRETIPWGTYHYCNRGECSWYGFTKEILAQGSKHETFKVKEIVPITTDQYPLPARRPPYSVLDTMKYTRAFDQTPPHWQESLGVVLAELYGKKTTRHTQTGAHA
ncbi:MAG TPA: dTDP-4-dehydrorhamnose reductase [Candidatus Ozemobacteraceae bacterium]|nr:dTDP-4-dehydrorhamnose reductase [Candidatus Ozemobacteraceae bacterium]